MFIMVALYVTINTIWSYIQNEIRDFMLSYIAVITLLMITIIEHKDAVYHFVCTYCKIWDNLLATIQKIIMNCFSYLVPAY